jgi:hypothetical protein
MDYYEGRIKRCKPDLAETDHQQLMRQVKVRNGNDPMPMAMLRR